MRLFRMTGSSYHGRPAKSWAFFPALCVLVIMATGCARKRDSETVIMLIESAPTNLDPRVGTDAQSSRIGELLFDSLLRRDAHSQLQPSVATSWESPDPLTYVFHLRKDIKFHDGRPLRARDAQYTLESLISGKVKSLKAGSFGRVAAVEAPDDATLVVKLKEPYASFLWNLTQGAFGIVQEGAGPEVKDHPIGSGPFRFISAAADEFVLLEANKDYWGGAPNLKRVEFKVVPDATTRSLELRNGSADIAVNSLPTDTVESLRQDQKLEITQVAGNTYQYIGMNVSSPKLTLPVRQALAYGLNRSELIKFLWRGMVQPADSVLPSGHWAHGDNLPIYDYDPGRAVQLLEKAGFSAGSNGERLRLVMKTSTDQGGRELAAVLQNQWRKIGIELEIQSFEFATFYADISKGNFELFSLRWIGGNEDPDIFEYAFHSSKLPPRGANRGGFSNHDADLLIEQARVSNDLAERRQIYGQLQELLNKELPYIHLWYLDTVAVHSKRLSNLQLVPDGSYGFLATATLESQGMKAPGKSPVR